ncbi:PA containing protein [Haloechinothrix sp. LS1_15]|uniref:PA containing protein n=1 Tax=Haloechinothrix sp. LS1_15 TaxID=2652248 RepID=UPI0029478471|nr:PA containing protein [Haloechinothrix sp. LS1_15]MDV6012981.1 PA containing protein [Haloechinothrix sp. LS1_15]
MRNMLVRAAEVRESEQQQIFDALDDIYARIAPVESIGAIRKRLSELPDRTEVSVLAERLDETMSRLEAQDKAIAAVSRAVEGIVDKLAKPFAQLDGRLDGVAGKFEGVAGRMDGLEDKLQNIHRRLDELDVHLDKQDSKLESVPNAVHGPLRERIEATESALRERIDTSDAELRQRIDEVDSSSREQLGEATKSLRSDLLEATSAIDAGERVDAIAEKLNEVAGRIDEVTNRINKVEDDIASRVGDLDGTLKARLATVESAISERPDSDSLGSLVRKSNEESERRIGGQLDEAMATFAELMLGGGQPAQQTVQPPPAPRQTRRSRNGSNRARNGTKKDEAPAESSNES